MPDEKEESPPLFAPEQLATPPSCPPLVGGFGAETPEYKAAREGRGEPEPRPLQTAAPESRKAPAAEKTAQAEAAKTTAARR